VLEALSLGAPVICSNTTSLPEVAGDAGLLVDPLESEAIAAAMDRLASGEVGREALREASLRQSRQFSWDASARKLLGVYEACVGIGKWG
jgi:glycosyltransferase involved in cell wall biosynthesis